MYGLPTAATTHFICKRNRETARLPKAVEAGAKSGEAHGPHYALWCRAP